MAQAARIAGVELGGTKCTVVLADGETVAARHTIPTATPSETLTVLRRQLDDWNRAEPLTALGIASFGPLQVHPTAQGFGRMLRTPKPGWSGADVTGPLTNGLACPWALDTDVNGAAIAEHRWGAARSIDTACYVTVGTGVGGGFVVNGRPLHGALHPEIGHIRIRRVPGDEFAGACPAHGDCIEGLVCGPALRERFGHPLQDVGDSHPLWANVVADLAELMGILTLTVSPERILLGGGVSMARPFLLPLIRRGTAERLASYLPFFSAEAAAEIICPPALGEDAGPMGAVALGILAAEGQTKGT